MTNSSFFPYLISITAVSTVHSFNQDSILITKINIARSWFGKYMCSVWWPWEFTVIYICLLTCKNVVWIYVFSGAKVADAYLCRPIVARSSLLVSHRRWFSA